MKAKRKTQKSSTNTNTDKVLLQCQCADAGQQTACPPNRDDTFSFTSCSLKKLLTAESPKIMMALIVIVGALVVYLVLRCMCCPAIITDFAQERRDRRSDDAMKNERKPWEASKSRLMSEFSELTGKDAKETNLHSGEEEYSEYMLPELSSILDPIKVNEGYGSNSLRDFYRKLLKTDIQIKNLKKGFTNIKHGSSLYFTDPNMPRLKRSPKILTDPARSHYGSLFKNKRSLENSNKYHLSDAGKEDKDDGKVLKDYTEEAAEADQKSSLEKSVEKQKLLMKEQKSGHDTVGDRGNIINQHEPADSTTKNALEHFHLNRYELFNTLFGRDRTSTQHRRLLQHDDDEDKDEGENVDYEDQTKEPWDREKRSANPAESHSELHTEKQTKAVPPIVNLARWKNSDAIESKPLYNEINYLIEAAIRMATGKLDDTENNEKHTSALINNNKEYFEDNGSYDDLVEMAQAYSDYGVLNNKKEIVEKNKPKAQGNTIKLLTSEKQHEVTKEINQIDNSLRGQRVKLKSSDEKHSGRLDFLKKFKHKMFSKGVNTKAIDNAFETTTINEPTTNTNMNSTHFAFTYTPWNIFAQKKTQKQKERNVLYSGHRRSLKSVEIEEANEDTTATESDVDQKVIITVKFRNNDDSTTVKDETYTHNIDLIKQYENNIFNIINETYNNNVSTDLDSDAPKLSKGTLKRNNTSWDMGEIFGMIADFCMFLSGFDENQEDSGYRFLYDIVTMLNPNYSQPTNKTKLKKIINNTHVSIEPSIDSEMVDNIGHRSRVLLSFEETTVNSTEAKEKQDLSESYVMSTNKENTNATREKIATNLTNIEDKKEEIEAVNRTVVKRSANGNVIFWNDLYDDEYGIKDPMEDDMKDKSSVKFNDLIGKDNWISNKFKVLAKSLKDRRNRKKKAKKNRKLNNSRNRTKTHAKRAVPVPDQVSSKHMFEGLTANMKRVCHEAAQAIRETTNREVRADGNQASTLMQQLVSLMSELVDLQVRAKTCIQLPEDLRSFLAWLTSPNTEEQDDMNFSVNNYDPSLSNLHNPESYDMLSNNARSECLGTIHDVEDLILQYDEMSEEDKSKMSGVREYLEHQLNYLHKQLSSFNEYASAIMYQEPPIRRRRQQNSNKKHRKQKLYKFLNYGRKHTTQTDSDDFPTEDYKFIKFGKNKVKNEYYKNYNSKDKETIENENYGNENANEKAGSRNENDVKRNLKEDYYSDLVKNNDTIQS